jgi:hypothetical protein
MNIICVQRVDNIKCLAVKAANLEPTLLQSSYDNYVITARAFFGEDSLMTFSIAVSESEIK